MIQKFVDRFMEKQQDLRQGFAVNEPEDYQDVVKRVISVIAVDEYGEGPDPQRIHKIDDGDYQGTLVFVIGANGYQPSTYYYVKVGYGSCSGCDTLEDIRYSADSGEQKIADYMTLALHIIQGLKKMGDDE